MSVNLVVWAWSKDYDTPAKRKRLKVKFSEIGDAWAQTGDHASMGPFDFTEFEAAVAERIGPEEVDGPYSLERHPHSRCYNLPFTQRLALVPVIGGIARQYGLNSAEF